MKKLFVFCLGGSAPGANVEVHDIQFAVAERPEDAWPRLAERWFGTRESLHIDGWGVLEQADGYGITLSDQPPAGEMKLWFVNLGAYADGNLGEEHANVFLVARTAEEAKARAKAEFLQGLYKRHRDNLREITADADGCLLLDQVGPSYVHLVPGGGTGEAFRACWQGYQPI
ncbi:DUF1543 domain-containing protein [Acetobacter sp. AN02]|uniref:DUF1543 domain-containing protein n=1 Tax=Acetobacter sp. AN02 TaxID=2894186 RepID=UPI002434132D|nr:DUF1543 domain-containing protein [Acetobacter sp. AN02]MDG6093649.1 DUF1543 domain-containing protein [Acetobacter sp. AN02]